jgi:CIC family chloride channel protein
LRDDEPVAGLAQVKEMALLRNMSVKDAMQMFDATESDTLAVVDDLQSRRLVGTLKESYLTRRYAEELEKAHGALP